MILHEVERTLGVKILTRFVFNEICRFVLRQFHTEIKFKFLRKMWSIVDIAESLYFVFLSNRSVRLCSARFAFCFRFTFGKKVRYLYYDQLALWFPYFANIKSDRVYRKSVSCALANSFSNARHVEE